MMYKKSTLHWNCKNSQIFEIIQQLDQLNKKEHNLCICGGLLETTSVVYKSGLRIGTNTIL